MAEWMFPTPKTAKRLTDDRERALYVISIAAELSGVHPQTLRMYERKGLVNPARTEGRARRYSESDIERIRMIQWLTQDQGVNLAGVEMLIEMNERMRQMQAEIERLRAELDGKDG